MGSINFDVSAVFIIILNFYLFYGRKRLFTGKTRIFGSLLCVSLGAVLMDIVGVATYWRAQDYPVWLLYAINTAYYLFQNSIPLAFTLFLLELGEGPAPMKRIYKLLVCAPWLLSLIIIIPTFATGFAFRFDEGRRYSRGPGLALLYGLVLIYAAICLRALYRDRRILPRDTRFALFLFLPFSLVPVAIQFLVPELLIQNLGIAVSELFILLTILDFGKYVDSASGFYNRIGLMTQLDTDMRRRRPCTLFLVSIDIVDFLRLAIGPESFLSLEREISREIAKMKGSYVFAALIGAGRFVLVLQEREQTEQRREEITRAFNKPRIVQDRALSVSAHACEVRIPEDTIDLKRILQASDRLSLVGRNFPGKTFLSLAELSLSDTGRQLAVTRAMQRALMDSGFEVHYQPILSSDGKAVRSAEALLRLKDEDLGWIPPAEFIPLAEQNGAIFRIGDLVIELSCVFLSRLRALGHALGYIEINLSASQCIQYHLVDRLRALVERYGLAPGDLCFEITETAAHLSPTLMKKNMDSLVDAGFSLAIDDFGTGYSNIGNLMEIPFRTVKLDRSLINEMERSKKGRIGVEEFIAVFRGLDTALVAEGVETADQLESLRAAGVGLIQGYYFSKPLPPDEFILYLAKREAACT